MAKFIKTCLSCGKEYLIRKPYLFKKQKYCSIACRPSPTYLNTPEINKKKGNSGKRAWNWKEKILHTNGYILVTKKDHPNAQARGYIYEHRLVMEENIGRYLEKGEQVHHRNGDKTDNRIENLEIIDRASHTRLHNGKRKYKKGVHYSAGTEFKKGRIPWNKKS